MMNQENSDPKRILRELQRKSEDQLRVRTLLDEDYRIRWDSDKIFVVPGKNKDLGEGKGEAVLPRYIAMKFMEEVTVLMINHDNIKHMKKYEKQYKGNPNVHWPNIEKRYALKTNDPELVKKYFSKMFVRVEKEFGLDAVPETVESKPRETKPLSDQIMGELESKAEPKEEVVKSDKDKFAEAIT